ncbi:Argonaute siRNA chaperone complex subunit Arb1 [Madurella fahalii]|uniref:Argonaute siRNA chaperone complex subunit Arb1 n=1 Tax=Madurella fahalii TaxID=1157608 RepID=A0ABQ0GNG4_9PEZI
MSSPREGGSAPERETRNDTADAEASQHIDIGGIRVEVDRSKDGKKKKRNNRAGRTKKKVTGFEEFYCDAPVTPAEHDEEKNVIYAPHRPFVDRIEECIQRFRARRRMSPEREYLFSRYLTLGGIDATVRQFQGTRDLGEDVLEGTSKAVAREMTADDVIQRGGEGNRNLRFYNPNFPEHWDVDFTGIAAGFLSEHLPAMGYSDIKHFRMGVEVVLNFLKYVDMHDVCPEYAEDVKNAQKVCAQALEEIPATWELVNLLPGAFNSALRALHCKEDEEFFTAFGSHGEEMAPDWKRAKMCQAVTLASLLRDRSISADKEWVVTGMAEQTFEVCEVNLPDAATRAKYAAVNTHLMDYPGFQPCGTITARPVIVRDGWDNTMADTVAEGVAGEAQFILEEDILKLLKVGMKLAMGVCTLNVGIKFIKYIKDVKPTFYVFLPQELMFRFKEPVLNPRPAPNIHDQDTNEDILAGIPIGDADD